MHGDRSRIDTALIRWASWHNDSPVRAGAFVLVMSLALSAAAYFLGMRAQRRVEAERSN